MKIALSATNVTFAITNNADEKVLDVQYDNYSCELNITKLIESGVDVALLIKQVAHNDYLRSIRESAEIAIAKAASSAE
jgi:hypothetical protein